MNIKGLFLIVNWAVQDIWDFQGGRSTGNFGERVNCGNPRPSVLIARPSFCKRNQFRVVTKD